MKLDKCGLIVKDDGDGGDTARNEWSRHLVSPTTNLFPFMYLFIDHISTLIRNPEPDTFWSDAAKTSRDQTLHAFTYLAAVHKDAFKNFCRAHRKRYWRCQNGDVMWGSMNVVWRASGHLILYPLVVVWDVSLLFGVLERCHWLPRWNQDLTTWNKFVWQNDPDDVGDDLNLQMSLIQPNMPSPVRWLARMLYKHCRPKVYIYGNPVNTAHACWTWYYRKEANNEYNLANLWLETCKKYF